MVSDSYAIVFAGQGAQSLGMLSLYAQHAAVAEAVAEAGDAIGVDLAHIIEHDEAALNQTINTQPAMLAIGVGVYRSAQHALDNPVAFAGHSLGEYTALVAAGALSLQSAARLVRRRAQLMQSAVSNGGMAAILGLDAAALETLCEELRQAGHRVWTANYNTANQIVLAGDQPSIAHAIEVCKERGAKRSVVLPMSVPSHCPLLQPAADEFLIDLQSVDWQPPQVPVIHSAAIAEPNEKQDIANLMALQLVRPVQWQTIIQQLADNGAQSVYECNPSKTLSNLGKKSGITHIPLDSSEALANLI